MRFSTRGIIVHPEDLTLSWLDRMADARLNLLGLHPVGGVHAHESLQTAIDRFASPEMKTLRTEAATRGITVQYEAHTMAWLLPRHLFSAYPEWFRMNEKGERIADFNFCVSNKDALDYIAERTAHLASLLDTGCNNYCFWLDDVSGYSCRCPECRKLSPGDQQLRAVNAMLKGLKRYNRNARLCYLAYVDALQVPKHVEPLDGVFLEYAPIRRDFHAPLNDPDNAKNAQEIAPLKDLLCFFGTEHSRVLEYWMDNSLYSNWTKPPKPFALDEAVMREDAAFYQSLGFEQITSFGCYLGPDYEALYGQSSLRAYGEILANPGTGTSISKKNLQPLYRKARP